MKRNFYIFLMFWLFLFGNIAHGSVSLPYDADNATSSESIDTAVHGLNDNDEALAAEVNVIDGNVTSVDTRVTTLEEEILRASDSPDLATAISTIGATNATLIIDSPESLSTNATFPSTLSVKINSPGYITMASNSSITINGPFESYVGHIFRGDGCANCTFALGATAIGYPEFWGAIGDGVNDDGEAIRMAILSGLITIKLTKSKYITTTRIIDHEKPPNGWTLEGNKIGSRAAHYGTTCIKYTGTDICFDVITPGGTSNEEGRLTFRNLNFTANETAAGMFQFNDVSIDPVDGGGAQAEYIVGVRFENCTLWGPGSSSTGNGIQAVKAFEFFIDDSCFMRGWKRAIYIKGCDNWTIGGRYMLNGRHIHAERSGTFGNGLEIRARFLGPCSANAAEDNYQIFLLQGGVVYASWFEGYSDGYIRFETQRPTTIIKPFFAAAGSNPHDVILSVADNATSIRIIDPICLGDIGRIVIETPDTWEWLGNNNLPRTITFVRPTARFITNVLDSDVNDPRIRIIDSEYGQPDLTHGEGIMINAQGVKRKSSYALTPFNIEDAKSTSLGWAAISGVIDDTGGYYEKVIALSTTNLSGISLVLEVGRDLNNGDTIDIIYHYRLESAKSAGTFRYSIKKNNVNVSNGEIGTSTTYVNYTKNYTLAGFSDGDSIEIGIYQATLDVRAFLAAMNVVIQ